MGLRDVVFMLTMSSILAWIITAIATRRGRPLVARSIDLIDEEGTVRAQLGCFGAESGLIFLDSAKQTRVSLGIDVNGVPALLMRDHAGHMRLRVSVVEEPFDSYVDRLSDKERHDLRGLNPDELARIAEEKRPLPAIFFNRVDGSTEMALGSRGIFLYDAGGDPVVSLGAHPFHGHEGPGLALRRSGGEPGILLGLIPGIGPTLQFSDRDGVKLDVGIDSPDRSAKLRTFDASGKQTWESADGRQHS